MTLMDLPPNRVAAPARRALCSTHLHPTSFPPSFCVHHDQVHRFHHIHLSDAVGDCPSCADVGIETSSELSYVVLPRSASCDDDFQIVRRHYVLLPSELVILHIPKSMDVDDGTFDVYVILSVNLPYLAKTGEVS